MKVLTRIYLCAALVFGTAGFVLLVVLGSLGHGFPRGALALVLFVLFAPAIGSGVAYVVTRALPRWWAHGLAACACLVGLGAWGFVAMIAYAFTADLKEVTNPKKYPRILANRWSGPPVVQELVAHFPKSIPEGATDVRFSYQAGFGQGGSHIQLRYATDVATLSALQRRFSAMTVRSFRGGETNDHMNVPDGLPTTFFYTSGNSNRGFPADYEIMVFGPIVKRENSPGGYWNHGRSHGVAISIRRHEIVYWAESW